MSKIYVVTSGCYSDYGINIVTTNREAAEAWIKNHASNDWSANYMSEYNIEEYDDYDGMATDLEELKKKELCYKFYADIKNGIDENGKDNCYYESKELGTRYESWLEEGDKYQFFIHTDDPDKAFKIACDMFAQAEAERLGL